MTTGAGCPVGDKLNSVTVGPRGPLLMQDAVFLDEMSRFDRERIPERVVHAKGSGNLTENMHIGVNHFKIRFVFNLSAAAHGFFEVTHDISRFTKAKVFEHIGKKTPIFMRFSTVGKSRVFISSAQLFMQ